MTMYPPEQELQQNPHSAKATVKYILMPGILPLVKRLAGRMGQFMHLFTMVFGAAGLIDKNHPCLRAENIGRYRFIDILGLAASNIRFTKEYIPQIIVFVGTVFGIILTVLVLVMSIIKGLFNGKAAQAQYYFSNDPATTPVEQDWAFLFLDRVFGKTGMGVWTGNDSDISFYTTMLRNMLSTYSMALMVLAVFIVIYLMVMSLVESARTGKPFGDRFDSIWAPVRLVTAIGLLVPIGAGYNSAQLITFQVSQWGSSLGTNVWTSGIKSFGGIKGLEYAFQPQDNYRFMRAMFLIKLCMDGWNGFASQNNNDGSPKDTIRPWFHNPPEATDQYITVDYGTEEDQDFCGTLQIPAPSARETRISIASQMNKIFENGEQGGLTALIAELDAKRPKPMGSKDRSKYISTMSYFIRTAHLANAATMINVLDKPVKAVVKKYGVDQVCLMSDIAEINTSPQLLHLTLKQIYFRAFGVGKDAKGATRMFMLAGDGRTYLKGLADLLEKDMANSVQNGWASAGAYLFKITNTVSQLSESMDIRPVALKTPVLFSNQYAVPGSADTQDESMTQADKNDPTLKTRYKGSVMLYKMLIDADDWFKNAPASNETAARALNYGGIFKAQMTDPVDGKSTRVAAENNFIEQLAPKYLIGIEMIPDNTFDPITKLVLMGDGFIDVFFISKYVGVIGPLLGFVGGPIGAAVGGAMVAANSLFSLLTPFYLIAGLYLKIWFPLQPFLFFMFGVMEWILSVLEAVVGMPLWALSFISTDGKGFFSDKAWKGVMSLFELMLRPTILIFSFLCVLLMFYASISFINLSFSLFLDNYVNYGLNNGNGAELTDLKPWYGFDISASLMCLVYVFVVYSTGNSLFKLIDKMPNGFMRWYGDGTRGFGSEIDLKAAANQYWMASAAQGVVGKISDTATSAGTQGVKILGSLAKLKSDIRLKRDISFYAAFDNLHLYKFRYLDSEQFYIGLMAQDLMSTHPQAVTLDSDGYYYVDYGMLDVPFIRYGEDNSSVIDEMYGVSHG